MRTASIVIACAGLVLSGCVAGATADAGDDTSEAEEAACVAPFVDGHRFRALSMKTRDIDPYWIDSYPVALTLDPATPRHVPGWMQEGDALSPDTLYSGTFTMQTPTPTAKDIHGTKPPPSDELYHRSGTYWLGPTLCSRAWIQFNFRDGEGRGFDMAYHRVAGTLELLEQGERGAFQQGFGDWSVTIHLDRTE